MNDHRKPSKSPRQFLCDNPGLAIDKVVRIARIEKRFAGEAATIPFTPVALIKEISDNIPTLRNRCTTSRIAVLYTIEWALYLIAKGFINVTLITRTFDPLIEKQTKVWGFRYMTEEQVKDVSDTFDVVVGNPPYKRGMHLDFLDLSIMLLAPTGCGSMIHPGTWLLNETPGSQKILDTIQKVESSLSNVVLFSGDKVFKDAVFAMPLSITSFTRSARAQAQPIDVDDRIRQTTYKANSIRDITKHAGDVNYLSLKAKILAYVESVGSLRQFINQPNGKHFVALPILIGNLNSTTGEPKSDFYNFVTRSQQLIHSVRPTNDKRCFAFETLAEAEHFGNYIKTFFARFCLSIAKFDRSLNLITLSTTPWLDFSRSWTDADLFELLQLTEAEKGVIFHSIQPYFIPS